MSRRAILSILAIAVAAVGLSAPAAAQSPRVSDVALSYSFLYDADIGVSFDTSSVMPIGWVGAVSQEVMHGISLVGEVGGNYKSAAGIALSVHTFQGGARLHFASTPKYSPFAQFVLGAVHGKAAGISSTTAFSIQPGGGVDVAVGSRVQVRVQADYRAAIKEGTTHEVRGSVGLVFGF